MRPARSRSSSRRCIADDDDGLPALEKVNLKVHAGEIVGIAGVSGNGQSQLVEVLSGQRPLTDGRIIVKQEPFEPTRDTFHRMKLFGLPEEPLKNATVPRMTVAENMAFRTFDQPPTAKLRWWLSPGPMRGQGARADRALSGQDAVAGNRNRQPVRRQRPARGAGARA